MYLEEVKGKYFYLCEKVKKEGVWVHQRIKALGKVTRGEAEVELAKCKIHNRKYEVIVVDPPWQYDNKRPKDKTHRGNVPYKDSSIENIKRTPIPKMAGENCILWLWTTNAFMYDALQIIKHWGFTQKTILTWRKNKMGLGTWLRGKTEHCILATKNKPHVNLTNQTTIIDGKVREHSRKPEEFYRLVEELCPGTKLDMFAREERVGWDSYGAERTKFGAKK